MVNGEIGSLIHFLVTFLSVVLSCSVVVILGLFLFCWFESCPDIIYRTRSVFRTVREMILVTVPWNARFPLDHLSPLVSFKGFPLLSNSA